MPSDRSLNHYGIVQSVAAGEAVIAIAVNGCGSCRQKTNCGIGQLAGGGKTTHVGLAVGPEVKAGDHVRLSISQDAVNRAALLGYLLPALSMVGGGLAGQASAASDLGVAAGLLAGLVIGVSIGSGMRRFLPPKSTLSVHREPPQQDR